MNFKIIFIVIAFTSCTGDSPKTIPNFLENRLSFYDPQSPAYFQTTWIRKAENIRVAHETFKKFGYKNLVDTNDFNCNPFLLFGYIKRPGKQLLDSLLISYNASDSVPKYYREFWLRRKSERNEAVVFNCLTELKQILYLGVEPAIDRSLVNDTLLGILVIKYSKDSLTEIKAKKDFDFLVASGLHESAYNLLFERYKYHDTKWDTKEMVKRLIVNEESRNCYPIIEDDTK
jgi:hypothetical protein